MKKVILLISTILILAIPISAFAYTECEVTVNKVWNSTEGGDSIWVCFNEGGCVYKHGTQLTEAQLSRFYAMALTAKTSGKTLIVRYPEDDLVCPVTYSRNDILGMWLK